MTVDERALFYHITFVREINLHWHAMCRILVLCVMLVFCYSVCLVKMNSVSKKLLHKKKKKDAE